ncbi:zinc ribbon domain-containing protein [Peptacetobacter sp.]|uniref:zinc ribbon domain-containing protein n=1 Tax=Peptacetobacter sp. TaxID=2991975 RepID=UPI0026209EBF|nr:zinc ribbon domain-containing protein [Peptacetobacter sp.]
MYCKNCGREIDDKAVICPNCGVSQGVKPSDEGGFGWSLLGCCIPIVGLVLYLVWKNEKPKTAKDSIKGAIVGFVLLMLYYLFIFSLGSSL